MMTKKCRKTSNTSRVSNRSQVSNTSRGGGVQVTCSNRSRGLVLEVLRWLDFDGDPDWVTLGSGVMITSAVAEVCAR